MNEAENLPADVHPEAALLPWYINGTLGTQERQQVDQHLESCAECRRELDELTHIQHQLAAAFETQRKPSLGLARSVMAQVAREASARRTAIRQSRNWLDGVDQWFRSLFLPQWVPTLAAVMLVAQFGLLFWVTMPAMQSEQMTSRSVGSPTGKFKVRFQEQATEGQIRSLLTAIHGRVIDGPDPDRGYVVEVIVGDPANGGKTLEMLRQRTDVVYSAVDIHS